MATRGVWCWVVLLTLSVGNLAASAPPGLIIGMYISRLLYHLLIVEREREREREGERERGSGGTEACHTTETQDIQTDIGDQSS